MPTLSYAEFKDAIARASELELAGVIHLATSRMRSLCTPSSTPQSDLPTFGRPVPDGLRGLEVNIYVAGCSGLKQRSKVVGQPIYKIGTTTRKDVDGRVHDLSKIRYGGYDPETESHHDGFDDYVRLAFGCPSQELPPGLRLYDGCITLGLPPQLSRSQFEARFRHALASHSVVAWALSGPGIACLSSRAVGSEQLPTLTGFPHGAVRAKELYVLSLSQATAIVSHAASSVCEGFGRHDDHKPRVDGD